MVFRKTLKVGSLLRVRLKSAISIVPDKSWTTLYFYYYPLLSPVRQLSSVDKSLGYSRSTMPPNLMQTFHSENLPATISAFRPDGEVPVLNEQYIDSGECRIFKAGFSNGESWSVRIPIHVQSDSHRGQVWKAPLCSTLLCSAFATSGLRGSTLKTLSLSIA